jgi:hypothetical protein
MEGVNHAQHLIEGAPGCHGIHDEELDFLIETDAISP